MIALQDKWNTIYLNHTDYVEAAEVLQRNRHLLPETGNALDLASGLGGNALLLANHGLSVDAWDISQVALTKLQEQAGRQDCKILTRQCQITPATLPSNYYDVIVISRFLDRSLCNAIMASLKLDGLLFYQTFTRHKLDPLGPSNPDYLLERNELLTLFAPLSLIYYQEYGRVGNVRSENRNEAYYIGQKIKPV